MPDLQFNQAKNIKWLTSQKPPSVANPNQTLKIVDLFSGCGGMTLGAIKSAHENGADVEIALAVDHNSDALGVYKHNFKNYNPHAKIADILDFFPQNLRSKPTKTEQKLSEDIGHVDILLAGPPCQGHSDLNNSTRRNDPRNKLYLSTLRAVKTLEPELVIIENVPTVIHSQEQVTQKATSYLVDLGYSVKEINVDFLTLSVPQTRKRHVIIAKRNSAKLESINITTPKTKPNLALGDFIGDLEIVDQEGIEYHSGKLSTDNIQRMNYLFDNNLHNLPDHKRPPCHRDKAHSYNSIYGRLFWDKPAQTLTSGYGSMGQGRYIHPTQRRTIHSREAARIQGIPDYFSFKTVSKVTELRQMIANAVPPQLTYCIINHFLKGEL